MSVTWSDWLPLEHTSQFTPALLAETLDGGQAFRWSFHADDDFWQGTFGKHLVRIRIEKSMTLRCSFPNGAENSINALRSYLGSETNWESILDSLPWRSDEHLATCLAGFRGLRILKQPFAETVLCFLCSATKQIPQIKIMCARLAAELGDEIVPGIHALPTWEQLNAASEVQLRALGLGFRAKNIKRTAEQIAEAPGLLDTIEGLPYAEAKAKLLALAGIGEKIADCALLFGAGKLEAFPVDTWIIKVLQTRYQLHGWTPSQLAQFGRVHFGRYAGFAQQFLFSYERLSARKR
ncbi:DNA glycosylase [Pelagicoccus sp. SDUM812003]|uniref:DNA glycosylase n=1 Tax=Pelagicoccus sp. SDUM812003 TaxID=3041267 RepID=UPI00280C9CFC|nr:DNA glycosylase [Pelagicoccus sp. SDUM812003]MDQ8205697.1 DNA glycosylase [Pelagicoccus sp. SDUM812003]